MNELTQEIVEQMPPEWAQRAQGVQFVRKGGEVHRWWHHLVFLFINFVGVFNKEFKRSFYEDYFTTLVSPFKRECTVYCPKDLVYDHKRSFGVIRHELRHVYDWLSFPFKFAVGYLFRKGRSYWERRAIVQDMLHDYERIGRVRTRTRGRLYRMFTGSMYFYMDVKNGEEEVDKRIRAVENEEVKDFGVFWEDWEMLNKRELKVKGGE